MQKQNNKRLKKTKDGKRIKFSGGKRVGAGNKPKGDDRKRGFYCFIPHGVANIVGKGDWELGVYKIKKSIQEQLDKKYLKKNESQSE